MTTDIEIDENMILSLSEEQMPEKNLDEMEVIPK